VAKAHLKAAIDATIKCFICDVSEPLATAHDHHRRPRAYGGTDDPDNRVWLCASCHTRLHRVQDFIVAGKVATAFELCTTIFPSKAKARGELWKLANEAAAAEREAKEVFGTHRTVVQVNLTIDTETWGQIKLAAKGQKLSAKEFVNCLLKKAVGEQLK
jgi:hypothetical protein